MPKALLLVFPGFSEFEVTVATAVLRARCRVETVALEAAPVAGEAGWRVVPDLTVEACDPADYEALLVPGSEDFSAIMDLPAIHNLIRAMDQRGRLVAAICGGPLLLAKAGILTDRPYTVGLYRRFRDLLDCFNEALFEYAPLVEAGNVLTAQGYAFVEFGLRIGERLGAVGDPEAVRAYYRGQGDLRWDG
jgi:4-methyl-5(b-hydroxyethyl)-thiazole monophosphate biosynthesis